MLATLLLQSNGYGFRKLLSLDAYYQRNRDEYIQALGQSFGQRFNADYDLTPWLDFFTASILMQAGLLETKLTDWRIMVDKIHRDWVPIGLSERQIDGLIYAENIGHITRKDYIEITKVSPLTATRDLMQLVKMNLLVPQGAGRNRRYNVQKVEKTKESKKPQHKLL